MVDSDVFEDQRQVYVQLTLIGRINTSMTSSVILLKLLNLNIGPISDIIRKQSSVWQLQRPILG